MERHKCKLCFRNFANGRALGGHMRSHMMNSCYAAKNASKKEEEQVPPDENFQETDEFQSVHSYSLTSSSSSDEEEEESGEVKGLLSYELMRESPKKSPVFVDQEFSIAAAAGSVVLQDGESETESSKDNPFCRRSKRVRKSRVSYSDRFSMKEFFQVKKSKFAETKDQSPLVESEPLSSISDTTPEEHVAYCLMMLSRDKWKKEETVYQEERNDDYSEDSGVVKVTKTKVRGKYRCETCSKFFRSYQALGGHRASHKKIKVNAPRAAGDSVAEAAVVVVEEKAHECPFCHRVFASGQALGGHKRSHFIGAATNVTTISPVKPFSRTGENLDIDLNLPAPTDDDEISH